MNDQTPPTTNNHEASDRLKARSWTQLRNRLQESSTMPPHVVCETEVELERALGFVVDRERAEALRSVFAKQRNFVRVFATDMGME